MSIFRYRDKKLAYDIIEKLKAMKLQIQLMHICGTHQDTLTRYGLESLLETCGVKVRQGPGCPVCVTTEREFEEAAVLAKQGKTVMTFGDVSKVPVKNHSLLDLKARGCDVRVVYGIGDAIKLAKQIKRQVVFMAVGFETTAPTTAATILEGVPENFSILCCHRYIPPALQGLLNMGEFRLDGIIEPGHVSTIIGLKPYEYLSKKYRIPQVVAGFEPLDVLMAVYMLGRQIKKGEAKVENEYTRVVRYEGNVRALNLMNQVFEASDVVWRGFPLLLNSGMQIKRKYEDFDSRKIWEETLKDVEVSAEYSGCRCGEVLRGLIASQECPLFGKQCQPSHPIGPCMVSIEGSCNIEFKYKRRKIT